MTNTPVQNITPIDGYVFMSKLHLGPKNNDYIETDQLKKQVEKLTFQCEILTAMVTSLQKEKNDAIIESNKYCEWAKTLTGENISLQRKLEKLENQ